LATGKHAFAADGEWIGEKETGIGRTVLGCHKEGIPEKEWIMFFNL
jgi:hypothetical protein